jgi:hypothetical protein
VFIDDDIYLHEMHRYFIDAARYDYVQFFRAGVHAGEFIRLYCCI